MSLRVFSLSGATRSAAAFLVAAVTQACSWAQPSIPYDHKIAILIGTGHYQAGRGKVTFRELPGVANDLTSVSAALSSLGFDEIYIYSDLEKPAASKTDFRTPLRIGESPILPVNSLHVARVINDLLAERFENSKERNLLLVYLSGHGGVFGKADRVIALPDSEVANPDSFFRVRKLLNLLADKAPSHIIL